MLTLISSPSRQALPSARSLLPSSPRRPGELLERLEVPAASRESLIELSSQACVPVDVAASLLVELRATLALLTGLGISNAERSLDRAAGDQRAFLGLSAAEGDYVRAVTHRRWMRRSSLTLIPVRVIARMEPRSNRGWGTPEMLDRACAWEAAAVLSGLNLTEWSLATAAALQPASANDRCCGPSRPSKSA